MKVYLSIILFCILSNIYCSENKSPIRYGMDIEINLPHIMGKLMNYYEFDPLIKSEPKFSKIPEQFLDTYLDDYLESPEAFNNLPGNLRKQLIKGLEFKKVNLNVSQEEIDGVLNLKDKTRGLPLRQKLEIKEILINNNALTGSQGVYKQPSETLVNGDGTKVGEHGVLVNSKGVALEEDVNLRSLNKLKERWRRLSYKEKLLLVEVNEMSVEAKGWILRTIRPGADDIFLKNNLNKRDYETLAMMEIDFDDSALEVKVKDDVILNSKESAKDFVRRIGKIFEIDMLNRRSLARRLESGNEFVVGAEFHPHLHVTAYGQNMKDAYGKELKELKLLEVLNDDRYKSEWIFAGKNGFGPDLTDRGFVYFLDDDRFEIRMSTKPLSSDIDLADKLANMDESTARNYLKSLQEKLLNNEYVKTRFKYLLTLGTLGPITSIKVPISKKEQWLLYNLINLDIIKKEHLSQVEELLNFLIDSGSNDSMFLILESDFKNNKAMQKRILKNGDKFVVRKLLSIVDVKDYEFTHAIVSFNDFEVGQSFLDTPYVEDKKLRQIFINNHVDKVAQNGSTDQQLKLLQKGFAEDKQVAQLLGIYGEKEVLDTLSLMDVAQNFDVAHAIANNSNISTTAAFNLLESPIALNKEIALAFAESRNAKILDYLSELDISMDQDVKIKIEESRNVLRNYKPKDPALECFIEKYKKML